MAYHRYQTEGWVLSSRPRGESSKYVRVLTRELGLVDAVAQGSRELKSKLRYGLDNLALSRIELVRGKETWRVVNTETIDGLGRVRASDYKRMLVARFASLVERLSPGEAAHDYMFDEIKNVLTVLESSDHTNDELVSIELACVARVLDALGYWDTKGAFPQVVSGDVADKEFLIRVLGARRELVREINTALKETQL